MSWRAFAAAAPEIAQLGRERLEQAGLAYLGTIRADGWPRVSPVETHVGRGSLLIGLLPGSLKLRDLERDPRCTVQSAVSGPDSGEPELKLYCRAVGVEDDDVRNAPRRAWWVGRERGDARVFALQITEAAFVTWDIERGETTVRSWSPERGARTVTRSYP